MTQSLKTVLGIAAAMALIAGGAFLATPILAITGWGTSSSSHDSQVITAMRRTEEISLLSLGIQGILERNQETTFLGMAVPGSDRATFMQYGFTGKLGIDGKEVKIEQIDEESYRISFPEFIFIGYDDVTFKVAAEKNGLLSWATPEIDSLEMVNEILTDDAKSQYISANEELLQEQATSFYESIIHAVAPDIELEFVFQPIA